MSTVFIDNKAISLPIRFASGDTMDDIAASVLNEIHLQRIRNRLRYALSRGDITADGLQAKADELHSLDLVPHMTLDDDDAESDPVMQEALSMARELIVTRMANEGLPPPKGLDQHAIALVNGMPALQERARQRVEARLRAASEAIEGVM